MSGAIHRAIAAGATIVTPNRRLAQALKREFDAAQQSAGSTVWASADVLPWSAWLERTFAEVVCDEPDVRVLAPAQELALWQQAIADSPQAHALLDTAAAARVAREAALLERGWRLDLAARDAVLHEDCKAYLGWSAHFRERCAAGGWVDAGGLPDAIATRVGSRRPGAWRKLVAFGFDALTPQQRGLFDTLRAAGCEVVEANPAGNAGTGVRRAYPTTADELTAVARSVRDLLIADPALAVGVVVPDLSRRRAEVIRSFDDALEPDRVLAAGRDRPRLWNLSLGTPLSACPLVHAAMSILRFARGTLPLTELGALLRSPFVADAEHENAARALLDVRLRRRGRLEFDIAAVRREAFARDRGEPHACRRLATRLADWLPMTTGLRASRHLPSAWSSIFFRLLAGLGWPGERTLDSEEFQTWEAWRELVSGLSSLDPVLGTLRYDDALGWLARLSSDALFQPESQAVPVQVLGVLESAGLRFDRLFVTGLEDETWPPASRPNPLLPAALQRARGVPHADADWELAFARRTRDQWLACARHVQFSHPLRDGDRVLRPSPLIAHFDCVTDDRHEPGYAADILAAARLETLVDETAPVLFPGHSVAGGAAVFTDQSACPFRAFARHRLGARGLEEGRAGLDARERGTLLHRALAHLWGELGSHAGLVAIAPQALDAALGRAVDTALADLARDRPDALTRAFVAIERERLQRLMLRLLDLERTRAPFRVVEREAPRAVIIAGLAVNARVDRIDAFEDGTRLILDYKSGTALPSQWLGERPDDPQLPLYAVTDPGDVAAVAFALVNAGQVGFKGLARAEGLLPGVEPLERSRTAARGLVDWPALLETWRNTLDVLAGEFLAGRADVAPKNFPLTCRYCELGALCRVRERCDVGAGPGAEDGDNE